MNKTTSGFTIVELLIVIVVIAILAAITVVAFNGVTDRANNSAVQNDLTNMAKRIEMDRVDRGTYIPGGSASGDSTLFPGFTFEPTKNAYYTNAHNLYYCNGDLDGEDTFRIMARSKSGTTYRYSPESGIENLGSIGVGTAVACNGLTDYSHSYGYFSTNERWYSWTGS